MFRQYYFDINGKKEPNVEAMLAYLLDADIVSVCGDNYDYGAHLGVLLTVNVNDVFGPCADGIDINLRDAISLFDEIQKNGDSDGVIYWACKKRNIQPWFRIKNFMIKDGSWQDWMEKLKENKAGK